MTSHDNVTDIVERLRHTTQGCHSDICDLCPMMDEAADAIATLRKQLENAREALREIADPISHMQQRAKDEGRKIDGHMAIVLSNDAEYLKGIAREALKGQPC